MYQNDNIDKSLVQNWSRHSNSPRFSAGGRVNVDRKLGLCPLTLFPILTNQVVPVLQRHLKASFFRGGILTPYCPEPKDRQERQADRKDRKDRKDRTDRTDGKARIGI